MYSDFRFKLYSCSPRLRIKKDTARHKTYISTDRCFPHYIPIINPSNNHGYSYIHQSHPSPAPHGCQPHPPVVLLVRYPMNIPIAFPTSQQMDKNGIIKLE